MQGNSVSDVFGFTNPGSLSGKVIGGTGNESLDFSTYAGAPLSFAMTSLTNGNGTVAPIAGGLTGIHTIQGQGGLTSGTAGNDSLSTASDTSSETWSFTANDAGNISNGGPIFSFGGIANYSGGQASNTFKFNGGTNVFGTLSGGSTKRIP